MTYQAVVPNPDHPAPWSKVDLDLIARLLAEETSRLGRRLRVLDPLGGVGRVHDLDADTVHADLQIGWAACRRPSVQANALYPPWRPAAWDAIVTSIVFGNRMCFAAGTLVTCDRGQVPIEDVRADDVVLTHEGRWRRVMWSGPTGVKPVVRVVGQGPGSIKCTPDHRILTAARIKGAIGLPQWTEAAESIGRYWATPARGATGATPRLPSFVVDAESFWFAVGWWLADGTVTFRRDGHGGDTVGWSRGIGSRDELCGERLAQAFGDRAREGIRRSAVRLWAVYSNELASWLVSHFGRHASGKNVPGWTLNLKPSERRAVVDGWLAGDGCQIDHGRKAWVGSSTNRAIIRGMQLLVHSTGGSASSSQVKQAGVESILGRLCTVQGCWHLRVYDSPTKFTHRHDGADWRVIRAVVPTEPEMVYDLEVEEDHSFVAEAVIVHNSDHHRNRDAHKACDGAGCRECKGTGVSPRKTYRAANGGPLHPDNAGRMQFGPAYCDLHERIYATWPGLLAPGGMAVVNASNFYRARQVVAAAEWHMGALARAGLALTDVYAVPTPRMRRGQNGGERFPYEHVIVLRNAA